ncbi:hypothetical protein [Thalassotalea fusca]
MPTLYRRIDFIHRKCVEFVANRERRLVSKKYERMYLCTDRQVYISNWVNRKEKKNCEFYVIGTADLTSSYILAYNFNYDPSLNPEEVERHAEELGEHEKMKHHRQYARAWLKRDFEAIKATKGKKHPAKGASLKEDLEQQIAFNELYDPDSASESYGKSNQLPTKGMEIHNDYTMAAHFHLINTLTEGVEKTRFFMDLDEGLSNSYKAAFKEQIRAGNSDGFAVSMTKHLTIDEKRKIARDRKLEVSAFCGKKYSSLTNQELNIAIRDMIKVSMENPTRPRNAYEAWVRNPMPSLNEVDKRIAAVTNIQRYDLDHQANLYRKASLHAIDRFFNQIRASLSPFARPARTGSGIKGTWYGYQPYNPELYTKLGEIFRVYFNYCEVDKKHKATPAMKLGLAKGLVDVEKIIYFEKYNK